MSTYRFCEKLYDFLILNAACALTGGGDLDPFCGGAYSGYENHGGIGRGDGRIGGGSMFGVLGANGTRGNLMGPESFERVRESPSLSCQCCTRTCIENHNCTYKHTYLI